MEDRDDLWGGLGRDRPQSRIVLYAYFNTATAPTVAPTGGTFVQSTGVKTVPTGYTAAPVSPPTGQETYRAEAIVNPATDANTVNLVWSIPAELPAYAAATLAAEYADDAAPVTWPSSTLGRRKTFLLAHRAGRWSRPTADTARR